MNTICIDRFVQGVTGTKEVDTVPLCAQGLRLVSWEKSRYRYRYLYVLPTQTGRPYIDITDTHSAVN